MNDRTFLQMLVERAQNVVLLQKKGRRRKAMTERYAIYRDIDFYCRQDTAAAAMYEKIMLYYLEEKPALEVKPKRKNSKTQRRKEHTREWSY